MLVLTPKTKLALADDILLQAIPGGKHFFAFNIKSGDHFKLNGTAYWLLEKISASCEFSKLLTEFAELFELDMKQAAKDLEEVAIVALDNEIVKEVEQ